MKATFLLVGTAALLAELVTAHAQLVVLKNGQTAPAKNLKRDGATLYNTVEISGRPGTVGYLVTDIDHLELPEPPQIGQAEQLIITGKPAEAVALLDPIVAAYYPLRDLKGNHWASASLLKSAALQAMGKRDEASALLTLLAEYPLDNRIALTSKARLAGLLALAGKARAPQALTLADSIIKTTDDPSALGEAWLAKGRALYVNGDYDGALDAFLHLPVFFDDNTQSTAEALLGSARCYLKLQDTKRAVRAFFAVQERYSTTPEAAEAKKEIEKGGAAMASFVKQAEADKAQAEQKLKDINASSTKA